MLNSLETIDAELKDMLVPGAVEAPYEKSIISSLWHNMLIRLALYLSLFFHFSNAHAGGSIQETFILKNGVFPNVSKALKDQYIELKEMNPSELELELQRCDQRKKFFAMDLKVTLKKGDLAYIPTSWVHPLQSVISYYGVAVNLFLKANQQFEYLKLNFHNGNSTADLDGAKEAVIGPDGEVYLLDGHHTFTASLLSGARTFPVKIVNIYRDLSQQAFVEALLRDEYIYLTDLETGKTTDLKMDFSELEDSPFRAWVDASGAEIPATSSKMIRKIRCETATPAWIRDANSIVPFAEFKVARILLEEGLNRENCPDCFRNSASLSEEVNETIRKFLTLAEDHGRFKDMQGIHVIREKRRLDEMNLSTFDPDFSGSYEIQIYRLNRNS